MDHDNFFGYNDSNFFEYNDNYTIGEDLFTVPTIESMTIPLIISSITFAICLICNSFVVVVVARRPKLQNFNYIGLACLAVVDVVGCICDVINNCLLVGYFNVSDLLCKTFASIPVFCNTFTALCISAIAVYKVKDTRAQLGRKSVAKSVGVVLVLALLSLAACTFTLVFYKSMTHRSVIFCLAYVPHIVTISHEITLLIINCVICSFIVIPCLVVSKKRRSKEVVAVDESGVVVKEKNRLDVRFESMMLVIWGVFVGVGIITALFFVLITFQYFNKYFVVQFVHLVSSCYKLFVYIGMDQHFRTQLKALLGKGEGSEDTSK